MATISETSQIDPITEHSSDKSLSTKERADVRLRIIQHSSLRTANMLLQSAVQPVEAVDEILIDRYEK